MTEYGELEIIVDTCNLNVNINTTAELDCHAVVFLSDNGCKNEEQSEDNRE